MKEAVSRTRHEKGRHENYVKVDMLGHDMRVMKDTDGHEGGTRHSCEVQHVETWWDGDGGHGQDTDCR